MTNANKVLMKCLGKNNKYEEDDIIETANTNSKCPNCGAKLKIIRLANKPQLGEAAYCPKCKESFEW